ncbi:methyl-accepting chemotaxis protein [bacterium]|nr:MAG: methyl-accepting chemotaxis protein [bacterium]
MIATLKGRVVAVSMAVTALGLAAVAGVILLTTQRGADATLDSNLRQLSQASASQIADWAASKERVVQSLLPAVSQSDISPELKAAAVAGSFDDVYVGYADKRATFFQKRERPAGYDPTKRGWYTGAVAAMASFISQPYVGAGSKKLTVTFAVPVIEGGKVTAVAAADVLMGSVQKTLAAIKPTPSSVAFLESADGLVVAHPDAAAVLHPVQDVFPGLTGELLSTLVQSERSQQASLNGHQAFVLARTVEGTPWRLVILVDLAEALSAVNSSRHAALVMVIVALFVTGLVLFLFLSRSMRRLDHVRDALSKIASGDADLTRRLEASGGREIEEIASAFNRFVDTIANVLRQVKHAGERVMSGASQLAEANQDLSARTERQAAALEETSASTQALSGTVTQNSQHTSEAATLASSSIDSAARGRDTVLGISTTMLEINQLTERIGAISEAVNGIAAQTNILALNAAVESARAGAAGRGFAVVAAEVRQLAQRTSESAREISVLATDARARVRSADELVAAGVARTSEIADNATHLSEILSGIASAGSEQAAGLDELRQALLDLDDVTQQNAALVEESAAATDALAEQSARLSSAIGAFRI